MNVAMFKTYMTDGATRVEVTLDELEPDSDGGTVVFTFTHEGLIVDVFDLHDELIGTRAEEYVDILDECFGLAVTCSEPDDQFEKMKQDYLRHHGSRCLWCGSRDMETRPGHCSDDDFTVWTIECSNCGANWGDVQILGDITDVGRPTKYFDKPEDW